MNIGEGLESGAIEAFVFYPDREDMDYDEMCDWLEDELYDQADMEYERRKCGDF